MKGHEYQFKLRQVCGVLLPTMVVLACIIVALKLIPLIGLMPAPAAALDPSTTVMAHQARAAGLRNPAEIVLLGDSTCLVGVDATQLSRELPRHPPALNLALLIWFDLEDYANLLADSADANPGQVRTVVLLVTPDKLSVSPKPNQEDYWRTIRLEAQGSVGSALPSGTVPEKLGFRSVRENLLSHVLATPLRGKGTGTAYFGFSSGMDAYMTAHQGSMLDFGTFVRPRHPPQQDWTFGEDFERESRAFRAKIPPGARLLAGLTPVAQTYYSPNDRMRRLAMLQKWNQWIQADALLTNLPPFLPDVYFANKGHLNEVGQKRFTSILASQLSPLLPSR